MQGTTKKVHADAFEIFCLTDLINLNEINKWKLANAFKAYLFRINLKYMLAVVYRGSVADVE